ncbi:MAG: FMN-binding glutamate synthase family protein, partial [Gammaproteobacteria bacterium]|nr:FMN-binding glutamate synthase family protein [Gammaproteobacteria bacterium]
MLSEQLHGFLSTTLQFLAALFVVAIGIGVIVVIILYILDISQTEHAIRRNYPIVGRFRYFFEKLGEFFRQYFFAMDREEMPFNRAQRSWVYRAAKNLDNTIAFGSSRDLRPSGTVLFVNCPFPTLGEDTVAPERVTVGPGCRKPYITASFFNMSAMSFGSISKPAVLALSNGARMAGC